MHKLSEKGLPLTVSVEREERDYIFRVMFGGRPHPRWYVRVRHGRKILEEHRCRSQIQAFKLCFRIYRGWAEPFLAGRPDIPPTP
jgi:hypothetical protein